MLRFVAVPSFSKLLCLQISNVQTYCILKAPNDECDLKCIKINKLYTCIPYFLCKYGNQNKNNINNKSIIKIIEQISNQSKAFTTKR
jgi:hypothetical protein